MYGSSCVCLAYFAETVAAEAEACCGLMSWLATCCCVLLCTWLLLLQTVCDAGGA